MPPIPSPNSTPAISIPTTPTAPVAPAAPAAPTVSLNIPRLAFAIVAFFMAMMLGFAVIVVAVIHFGGFWPSPSGPTGTDFVKLGQAYVKPLAQSYAPAWQGYAADIRNGKTMTEATKNMAVAWDANRAAIYGKMIAPELEKILPSTQTEAQITPAQKAAMAAAAEALAKGLGEPP